MTFALKGKTSLLQNNDACLVQLFRCFIHMEGYIAHIQPWPVSFKNTTYTQGFYFIVMLFFVLLHEFQSNGSLPCEGGFAHACTIFLKEYHNHCLKWVLKGFLSQGILHPLFSRNVLLYSMKFCKKWCYASTFLSEYRVLHPFRDFFLTLKLFPSTTASIEAFYAKAMVHYLEGMPHHV